MPALCNVLGSHGEPDARADLVPRDCRGEEILPAHAALEFRYGDERGQHYRADMQHACAAFNVDKPAEERVLLCVGVGFGRVLRIGTTDVFGQEVNAASKLGEDTAKSGEILVTRAVREACGDLDWVEIEAVPGSDQNFRLVYE